MMKGAQRRQNERQINTELPFWIFSLSLLDNNSWCCCAQCMHVIVAIAVGAVAIAIIDSTIRLSLSNSTQKNTDIHTPHSFTAFRYESYCPYHSGTHCLRLQREFSVVPMCACMWYDNKKCFFVFFDALCK